MNGENAKSVSADSCCWPQAGVTGFTQTYPEVTDTSNVMVQNLLLLFKVNCKWIESVEVTNTDPADLMLWVFFFF